MYCNTTVIKGSFPVLPYYSDAALYSHSAAQSSTVLIFCSTIKEYCAHILQHYRGVLYSHSAALSWSTVLPFCSTIVEYCTPILQHYSESGQSSRSLALAWLWLSFDFTVLTFCSAHLISSPAVGSLKGRGEWPG